MAKTKLKDKIADFKYRYKTEVSTDEKMSTKEITSFALTDMGQNGLETLKTSFYNVFMSTALGLDASTIALLATITAAIGYLRAPICSLILDNTRTRWGRFKPYAMVCLPIIVILTFAFFANPFTDDYSAKVVYVYVVEISIAILSGFSGAWGNLALCITRKNEEKERFLTTARVLKNIIGCIPGAMPILIDLLGSFGVGIRPIFVGMAIILFPISLACVLTAKNIKERVLLPPKPKNFNGAKGLWRNIKLIFKNKNIIIKWLGGIPRIFNYVADIACAYVFMYCYGLYSWQTVVWLFGSVSEWAMLFFGKRIINKISSKGVLILYQFMMGTSMFALAAIGYGGAWYYMLAPVVLRMFGAALEYVEPIADTMLNTDIWDHYEWKYGVRNEATTGLIGSYVMMPLELVKPLIYAFVFNKIGFQAGDVAQTEATKQGLFYVYTIGIGLGAYLSTIQYFLIRLDKNTMQKVRLELAERKKSLSIGESITLPSGEVLVSDVGDLAPLGKEDLRGVPLYSGVMSSCFEKRREARNDDNHSRSLYSDIMQTCLEERKEDK